MVSEPEQADPDGDTGIRLAGATTAARAWTASNTQQPVRCAAGVRAWRAGISSAVRMVISVVYAFTTMAHGGGLKLSGSTMFP